MGLTISDKMNEAGDNYGGWNNHDPRVNPLEKDSENTAIVLRRLHGQCGHPVIGVIVFSSFYDGVYCGNDPDDSDNDGDEG